MFNNYWLLINSNIATYLTGSSLIPLGLTWWQAIICIVIGNLLAAAFCVLNSLPGAYYHGMPGRTLRPLPEIMRSHRFCSWLPRGEPCRLGDVGFPIRHLEPNTPLLG